MKIRNISISALLAASVILPLSANAFTGISQNESAGSSSSISSSNIIAQADTPESGGRRGRRGKKMQRMIQELGLTPEQQGQVKAIKDKYKQEKQGLRQQMRAAKQQMQSLMGSDASDSQIREQYQTVKALKQQMGDKRFEMMLEIRQVLTPEQRQKFAEMRQKRWEKRGNRRGGRIGA